MTITKTFTATAIAAVLGATAAGAQMFGDEMGANLDRDRFDMGFQQSGYYDALDRDRDGMLNENEYATGLFADYDRDADLMITEDEFNTGNTRYLGEDYQGGAFADYDANADGMLERGEFREVYGTEYSTLYTGADRDADGMLNQQEFGDKLYESADVNRDQIITIDEEGWFEGWFDGDDIEAEVEQVGDLM